MEILHTTGIHKQGVDQKKVKKVRKKGSTFCPPEKVSLEGSPIFKFFSIVEKQAISNCSPVGTKHTYNVLAKTQKKGGGR